LRRRQARRFSRGGNAVDAAIAANAVMGVVAPMMSGIGGDLFAIVYDSNGEVHGLNGSGYAPAALTVEGLRATGVTSMPQTGILSVTVPGCVAAWTLLQEKFGRLPLADLLSPAIQIADEGFPVPEITALEWSAAQSLLRGDHEATRVFLPEGHAPAVGTVFRNPDLAATYRAIAFEGRDAFYRGDIARRMLMCSRRLRRSCRRRPRRLRRGLGRSAHDHDRGWTVRAAAERPGHRGAHDAQPAGAVARRIVRAQLRRGAAHDS
jgi:gamma-glutamyltranspeptidase/glutathione hydrolase